MPTVELNGTEIYYETAGSGVPVICIHPPLLTGSCFAYLRERLADAYQIITLDIRGHGTSQASGKKVTLPLLSGDIRQLLDVLHLPQAYLCGYSMGGMAALHAMLTYPDRFYGGILISSMPEVNDWYNRSRIWAAIQISRLRGKSLLAAALSAGNADKLPMFKRLYSQAVKGHIRSSREYFASGLNYTCTDRLAEIDLPVQLIYGQKDKRFYRYAQLLHRGLPHNSLQFIAGGKHQLPLKNAPELASMIRAWLDEAEAARAGASLLRKSRRSRDQADMDLERLTAAAAVYDAMERAEPKEPDADSAEYH